MRGFSRDGEAADSTSIMSALEKPTICLGVAAALFIEIFVLCLLGADPGAGAALLFVVPVVVLGAGLGARAGLLGGVVAFALAVLWALSAGVSVTALGCLAAALVFPFVGGLVGHLASTRRAAEADSARLLALSEAAASEAADRQHLEQELERLSQRDPLTGLYNRRHFESELRRQLAYTRRYGNGGALLLIDLDRFKQINDLLGHAAGDEALCEVGRVLGENLRGSDAVVARLGGDEFVALLPEAKGAGALAAAERLINALGNSPLRYDGRGMRLRVSVGAALFDEYGLPGEQELLAAADRAMYEAKAAGGNGAALATPAA